MKSALLQIVALCLATGFASTLTAAGPTTTTAKPGTTTTKPAGPATTSTSTIGAGPTQAPSLSDAPSSYAAFGSVVSKWATQNEWVGKEGSDNLPVLLIPTANTSSPSDTAPVRVQFGSGYFEVDTIYSSGSNFLRNTTVSILVPLWGLTNLSGPLDIPLSPPVDIPVAIPGTQINGTITFFLDPTTKSEVLMGWKLFTPFAGNLDEKGLSVFPDKLNTYFSQAQLEGTRQFTDAELKALSNPPAKLVLDPNVGFANPNPEQKLLQEFINNYVDPNTSTTAIQTFGASTSGYTVDVSFLSILELSGNVDPSSLSASVTLYVKIPLAGRISLTKIEGSLINGITANINVILASGRATISAPVGPSGKHDLTIDATLSIQFVGDFGTGGKHKILTLPF
ncbi:hypothetical protein MIND_01321400 [Mycena indigotica]|uniref:Uncharacterized protein n=1 Tax=Mycena indigotica TaxID=2126181 RepID=A0A8H6VR86_9AGAR|nr:uncharacterized protein MIND_01321400 [Mycena indigotica]KAF7290804.1 hypothetical protein MIND_01321400 [Mycena indigotica]